jgi:hypothetical protein
MDGPCRCANLNAREEAWRRKLSAEPGLCAADVMGALLDVMGVACGILHLHVKPSNALKLHAVDSYVFRLSYEYGLFHLPIQNASISSLKAGQQC